MSLEVANRMGLPRRAQRRLLLCLALLLVAREALGSVEEVITTKPSQRAPWEEGELHGLACSSRLEAGTLSVNRYPCIHEPHNSRPCNPFHLLVVAAVWKAAETAVKAIAKRTGSDLSLTDVQLETLQVFTGRQHHLGLSLGELVKEVYDHMIAISISQKLHCMLLCGTCMLHSCVLPSGCARCAQWHGPHSCCCCCRALTPACTACHSTVLQMGCSTTWCWVASLRMCR